MSNTSLTEVKALTAMTGAQSIVHRSPLPTLSSAPEADLVSYRYSLASVLSIYLSALIDASIQLLCRQLVVGSYAPNSCIPPLIIAGPDP